MAVIGSFASCSASPAWGNLIFLPMTWLSGILIPLPEFLENWFLIWLAFHLDQSVLLPHLAQAPSYRSMGGAPVASSASSRDGTTSSA